MHPEASEEILTEVLCYHCGNDCKESFLEWDNKKFCCSGCKTVYALLKENNLCYYYDLEKNPGNTLAENTSTTFDFLELDAFKKNILLYADDSVTRVVFNVPGMHCLSCIWLLEHLGKIKNEILSSRVDFHKKKIFIDFKTGQISIPEIARLLTSLGYEPYFNQSDKKSESLFEKIPLRIRKIAVAGFAFGNIMLLSFPEYLGLTDISKDDVFFHQLFSWLNIILTIPVLFYSASEFFTNTLASVKNKYLNIDAPVALALVITFLRSLYEIFVLNEHGYFDSLSGIVFFMLIARYVQEKSSWWAGPGKEIKNYLPLAVTALDDKGHESYKPIDALKENDIMRIRNGEVVPADSILLSDFAWLNMAMLNGESGTVKKEKHQHVYAGARNEGKSVYLKVIKPVKESYFTQLWNNSQTAHKEDVSLDKTFYVTVISKYFTYIVLILSLGGFLFHLYFTNIHNAFKVITTVLIIACPCALLLATGFTSGLALHELRKKGIFFRNEKVPDLFGQCKVWAIDKTGTLSHREKSEIIYKGQPLSPEEKSMIAALTSHSKHPLSRKIFDFLYNEIRLSPELLHFEEISGKGLKGLFTSQTEIRIGSLDFTGYTEVPSEKGTLVFVNINNHPKGYFLITSKWRNNISALFKNLRQKGIKTIIATGDHPQAIGNTEKSWSTEIRAGLKPDEKLKIILEEKQKGNKVCMIGDGMNDVPAMAAADVSVTVNESGNHFLPESDMILDARYVPYLDKIYAFSKSIRTVVLVCFVISVIYNLIGLYFALSAQLRPVIAAILMPASTLSIVLAGYAGILMIKRKLKTDLNHEGN
jgi:Cu+-exporting ATPase